MVAMKDMVVGKVELGKGMAEVMNMQISLKGSKKRNIAVAYVLPRHVQELKRITRESWMIQLGV